MLPSFCNSRLMRRVKCNTPEQRERAPSQSGIDTARPVWRSWSRSKLPAGNWQSCTCLRRCSFARSLSSFSRSRSRDLFSLPGKRFFLKKEIGMLAMHTRQASHDAKIRCKNEWIGGTRVGVRVRAVQTSHTAHNVKQVNGRPGKGHAEVAQTTAGLFRLLPQLLQLLLVLQLESRRGRKGQASKRVWWRNSWEKYHEKYWLTLYNNNLLTKYLKDQ